MKLPAGFDQDNPQVWITDRAEKSQRLPDSDVYVVRPEDWPRLRESLKGFFGADLFAWVPVYEITEEGMILYRGAA